MTDAHAQAQFNFSSPCCSSVKLENLIRTLVSSTGVTIGFGLEKGSREVSGWSEIPPPGLSISLILTRPIG